MVPQVVSGARTLITFNGRAVGAGFAISYQLGSEATEIRTVDSTIPAELAPSRISARLSIQVFRTPDNDPVLLGIAPTGDGVGYHKQKYISVEMRDKDTDQTVLYLPKCLIVSRSGSVSAEDLLVETWSLVSLGWKGPTAQKTGVLPVIKALL
jgi:hypothetical protein